MCAHEDPTNSSSQELEQQHVKQEGPKEEEEEEHEEQEHRDLSWPEEVTKDDQSSWLHQIYIRLTYSFMKPILYKGARQKLKDGTHLCQNDLFHVPTTMESKFLSTKFETYYKENNKEGTRNELLYTLYYMASPSFLPAGFCELITVLCQCGTPLLVRELLRLLEEFPSQSIIEYGLPYTFAIFIVLVINAFANHRHRYLATQSGIILRSTIVSVVYERVLKLSSSGRQGMTSGEVTNIIAIDTQKVCKIQASNPRMWCFLMVIMMSLI